MAVVVLLLGLGLIGTGITAYWLIPRLTSSKPTNSSTEPLAADNTQAKDGPAGSKPDDKKPDDKNPDEKKPDPLPQALPTTLVVALDDGVKMDFVLIDPKTKPDHGKFLMGSPPDENLRNLAEKDFDAEKQHTVELTKPYYLAKYLVTQKQYAKVVGLNPSAFRKGGRMEASLRDVKNQDTSRFPVENVGWDQATEFCKVEMDKYGVQMPAALRLEHYRFALPTEAQWEYACRAGTKTPFYFGDAETQRQCKRIAPKFTVWHERAGAV